MSQQKSIFSDNEEEMVECQECGNKVNKNQIHDKQKLVCIGCHHRKQENEETFNKHEDIESPDHSQDIGENLLNQYRKQAEQNGKTNQL